MQECAVQSLLALAARGNLKAAAPRAGNILSAFVRRYSVNKAPYSVGWRVNVDVLG